jgi:cell division protein FtsQ
MRDLKHLYRESERKEPSIGSESKSSPAVANVRQKKSQVNSPSGAIRDVLMDDLGESRETKPAVVRERARQARKPQVVRDQQSTAVADSFLDRATGNLAGRWLRIQHWLKKIALVLLVGLAIWGIYKALDPLAELFQRPIKSVTVEGEFHFISQERATQLIMQEIDQEFLQIDLVKIKKVLLADPWVDKVTLTRRWPDTLVVKITEQKPIARWGEGFLNQRGEIVRVQDLKGLQDLPWLQGEEIYAGEILQQYQDLSLLLRPRGLEIVELKCDSKKSWRLTLKNAVEIAIGRDQVMEKMRRFVTVYEAQLHQVWQDVKSIDVRYSNGVAVRWIEGTETAKKMIKIESLKPAIPTSAR